MAEPRQDVGPTARFEGVKPVPAASILLTAPGHGGLEILMVRRSSRGSFSGIWVFPGGTVDPGDHAPRDASPDGPFRRAAVRELAEEVGIAVDVDSLAFVSRWVTPAVFPRRYDTRFFLAPLGSAQPPKLATDELEEASYITPAAALGAHQAQQWPMVLPTLAHLRWLARFTTIEQAIAATRKATLDPVTPIRATDGIFLDVDIPW